MKEFFTK